MVPGLVIRAEDYERAWNERDVFGTTMAPQIHYLRHYTVLFIGFSFADQYVCTLLRRLKKDSDRAAGSAETDARTDRQDRRLPPRSRVGPGDRLSERRSTGRARSPLPICVAGERSPTGASPCCDFRRWQGTGQRACFASGDVAQLAFGGVQTGPPAVLRSKTL
jgi:hypothetical protein